MAQLVDGGSREDEWCFADSYGQGVSLYEEADGDEEGEDVFMAAHDYLELSGTGPRSRNNGASPRLSDEEDEDAPF
jgi:hypothetical protein